LAQFQFEKLVARLMGREVADALQWLPGKRSSSNESMQMRESDAGQARLAHHVNWLDPIDDGWMDGWCDRQWQIGLQPGASKHAGSIEHEWELTWPWCGL